MDGWGRKHYKGWAVGSIGRKRNLLKEKTKGDVGSKRGGEYDSAGYRQKSRRYPDYSRNRKSGEKIKFYRYCKGISQRNIWRVIIHFRKKGRRFNKSWHKGTGKDGKWFTGQFIYYAACCRKCGSDGKSWLGNTTGKCGKSADCSLGDWINAWIG